MKKNLLYVVMLLAATALFSCTQEPAVPEVPAAPDTFEMTLKADLMESKTYNDGFSTNWGTRDNLTVFFAENGTTDYSANNKFTIVDASTGHFKGVISPLKDDKFYDWYAIYPYNSNGESPTAGYVTIGSSATRFQLQYEAGNMSHIAGNNYPLWGRGWCIPGVEAPNVNFSHLSSLLKITIINSGTEDLPLSRLTFAAPESVIGRFYVDITGDEPVFTDVDLNVSNTAVLEVENEAVIAPGERGYFYMGIKPFTAEVGSSLYMKINDEDPIEYIMTSPHTFEPGIIHNVQYDVEEAIEGKQDIPATIAEFLAAEDDFNNYVITGVIGEVTNTTYGNFYLKDDTGEVYIYGLVDSNRRYIWSNYGLKSGDTITLKGSYTVYDNKVEIQDAVYVSHVPCDLPEVSNDLTPGQYEISTGSINAAAIPEADNWGYLYPNAEGEAFRSTTFKFSAVDGGYTIQQADGRYLYMTGSYNNFNVSAELPSEGHVWTVTRNDDDRYTIRNVLKNKYIQYVESYASFGSYSDERGLKPYLNEVLPLY